jgi:DNA repair protein RecN (Recombination protein N)
MLLELAIRDFAIIDRLTVRFQPGLNVLTGATGAGKSILIDALGAVLGERTPADVVRTGAQRALVDATFDVAAMLARPEVVATFEELGVEPEDGLVILSREIGHGRSGARINGRAATASVLQRLGALLIDIHGQSEHLSLLRQEEQRDILDRYAGTMALRGEFGTLATEARRLRGQIADLERGARDREQRIDLLAFQANEIAAAGLRVGEEEDLQAERQVLHNAERLTGDAATAYALLSGGDDEGGPPALTAVRQVAHLLAGLAAIDPAMAEAATRAKEQAILLEDLAAEVRVYRDGVEADPARLEEVEDRLDLIARLRRKYGATVADIIAFGDAAQMELESLTGGAGGIDGLRVRLAEVDARLGATGARLSHQRQEAAQRLARAVEAAIAELAMGRAHLEVAVTRVPAADGVVASGEAGPVAFDASGIDRVEFLLAPNVGEALKPLARIASGGEMARVMLALKSILSEVDSTPTLVFDEIDTGVGGRSGQIVGEKLWGLTASHQVLAITHLPQIAAFGDVHFRISKSDADGKTASRVDEIDGDERAHELASMLGVPVTPASLANAADMMQRIVAWKQAHVAGERSAG